ncbi:MAG: dTMP kinase [Rhodothermales bacterium]
MLLTFEGIDGSGKSTQARLLVERLRAEGASPLLVREPGGTDLSEHVRSLLLDPALPVEPFAELLLFSAARAQLVAERLRPALREGRVVVCDRFYDSTTAYQGGGRELEDMDWLREFNRHVTQGLVPDRTYLLDIDPATALARRAVRHAEVAAQDDRMEAAGLAFYQRVASAYRRLAREEPGRILSLDGTDAVETIHARIWDDVQHLRPRSAKG